MMVWARNVAADTYQAEGRNSTFCKWVREGELDSDVGIKIAAKAYMRLKKGQ